MTDEQHDGIAIIGMAGRFPGANSVEELWANLVAGTESVSFFNDAELSASGLDPAALARQGHYVPARGVLDHADCFDAAFFGIRPKEAEVMDPQQRVFLEACWSALERAGYAPGRTGSAGAHDDSTIGVFAGATFNTFYLHALHDQTELRELVGADAIMFGNEKDYLTTRVAYKLGLKGPALNVSTACSTSLVAVCQACQSLLLHQCDMALAGGVSVTVPQQRGYFHDEGNIGSADGHTRTFDARATGTVFGNGVGVVVLKRLDEAIRDGDQIYAVIKGAALNNDGAQRVSFGAPGVEGQADVIALAHALADVDPETITYVEAHGTATPLGDPIEVAGLTKAFRLGTDARQFCALGSVKTNLGHLDAAAGVTGLIKTALSLHHRLLPATLHFETPNPKLEIETSPFYVNATLQPWQPKPGVPLRAGVSSFGSGGTNAHVVLEEAPQAHIIASGDARPWQLLVLSAKTEAALARATENLAQHLEAVAAAGDAPPKSAQAEAWDGPVILGGAEEHAQSAAGALADTAFTLQTGRSAFAHRRIVACQSAAEAAAALRAGDPKRAPTHEQRLVAPPVAFMFPGQGAQYPGMGAELYRLEPVFRAEVDRCAEILRPLLRDDLRTLMFGLGAPGASGDAAAAAREALTQTRVTQPALFVIEYALAQLWMSWGITPAAMIGHSVGEYVAACLAGVFTLDDALAMVAHRGALVQAQPPGAMLAVRLPEAEVTPLLSGRLAIAAINAPSLCVVSGPHDEIAALEATLKARDVAARHLQTSHAFHSPMMDPVLPPFLTQLRGVCLSEPRIPYVSTASGTWISADDATRHEYWASHVRDTVRFADGVAQLMQDASHVLLEVGPGQTLATLARQHPARSAAQTVIASLPVAGEEEPRGLLEALGRVWMTGVDVEWRQVHGDEHRRRVALPTYPFERTRHWPAAPTSASVAAATAATAAAKADALPAPATPPTSASVPASPSQPATSAAPAAAPAAGPTDAVTSGLVPGSAAPSDTAETVTLPRRNRLLYAARTLIQDLSGYDLFDVDPSVGLLELGLDSLLLTQASQIFQRRFGVQITFRQLMEELGSLDEIVTYLDARMPPDTAPASPQQPASAAAASAAIAVPAAAPKPKPDVKAHGPFRPIDRSTVALSTVQRRALDALIARYTARTATSKAQAAANRPVLADPRSAAGFKPLWKEMVYPIVTTRSDGSHVWDVDGNDYVDFVMGFGASLFGHRPPFVVEAIEQQLARGFEIGPIGPLAGDVATLMTEFTGLARVGFTNTGSEAVLAATRLARTVTGRDKIALFAGAYHGIFDEVLSRPLTVNGELRTAPIAPGIPDSAVSQVIVLDYGNPQSLDILRARGAEIAAVLVEPVQSRRLDLQPREFMHELRRVADDIGAALIFDEVVTGFRVHPGGAQAHFGVRADIATYGKVIGGGLPIGVVAGSARFMDALDGGQWRYGDTSSPEVGVTFFAGTFVRHPLALAAAKAVLTHLKTAGPALQQQLTARTAQMATELRGLLERFDAPFLLTQFSSLIQLGVPPDQKFGGLLFYLLRDRGIHIFENRAFVMTTAHNEEDLAFLAAAFEDSLAEMRRADFLPARRALTVSRAARDEGIGNSFPLTAAQQEVWLAMQLGRDAAVAYNESLRLDFSGALDVDRFRAAIDQVVQRHPIVLARITDSPAGPMQEIPADARLTLAVTDLSEAAPEERERALAALIEADVSTGFDLAAGPLLRVQLVQLSADHHVAIWTAHHIACDGWSNGLLIHEVAAIYNALGAHLAPALDQPQAFRDYARQMQDAQTEAHTSLEYWRARLADPPPALDLPADRPRPRIRSTRASTTTHALDENLRQALKRTAARQRTTLVVLLSAALKTLLHRLSGQTDIVLGMPVAGQSVTDRHCLVGQCVNLLPVRSRLTPETSFADTLTAVRADVLDAFDHHHVTLGEILQHVTLPRSTSRPPLVEVIFNIDRDASDVAFTGVDFACVRNPKRALHFDLFFNVIEQQRGWYLECDYNADLFDETTIARWMQHFEILLSGIVDDPAAPLDRLPLLTAAERDSLLRPASSLSRSPETLHAWFARQAEATPQARAVTYDGRSLTYDELNGRANQVAHHLRALGVGRDVLVGLYVERSLDMVIGLLGILKAGGAYLPIDPVYPHDRVLFMLDDARAPVLVTQSSLAQALPPHQARLVGLDTNGAALDRESTANPAIDTAPDDLAYVIYTSGSTGTPKGTLVTHHNVTRLMRATEAWFEFEASDVWTLFHSHAFDFSVWEIWGALCYGGRLVIVPYRTSRSPEEFHRLVVDERVTVLNQTPSAFYQFIDADARSASRNSNANGGSGSGSSSGSGSNVSANANGSSNSSGGSGRESLALRYVIFGGEALDVRSLAPWFDRHGDRQPRLVNMYGITETTVHVTGRPLTSADVSGGSVIGEPIPDLQIYLLDRHQEPVPIGVPGEIHVGGAGVARGYLRRDELTREKFLPDLAAPGTPEARRYRSGDLARRLANGDLEYLGRIDDQVKIRGFRIELGEIETALARHVTIKQAVVLAREDTPGEKRLVAYLEPAPAAAPATATAAAPSNALPAVDVLRAFLEKTLPAYMIPAAFVTVSAWPLTSNGKLDRKALPAPSDERPVLESAFIAPRTPAEQRLATLWRELLGVQQIGIRDDFFHLGGHSLLAMRLVTRVHQEFGVQLPPGALFEHTTLEALAHCIDPAAADRSIEAEATGDDDMTAAHAKPIARPSQEKVLFQIAPSTGPGTPFFWVHGVGGEVFSYVKLSQHLAAARPVFGFAADWSHVSGHEAPTLEVIAAHYVRELRRLHPKGPYHLGGFCSAAMLALEMARQLEAAGDRVGVLAAVDYDIAASHAPTSSVDAAVAFCRNLPHWVREDAMHSNWKDLFGRLLSRVRRLSAQLRASTNGNGTHKGRNGKGDLRDHLGMWRFPDYQVAMLQAHHQAIHSYLPKPFEGKITLFRPRTAPLLGPWPKGYDHAWHELARGGVEAHEIRGSHVTMLIDPFAAELAVHLNAAIDDAEHYNGASRLISNARTRLSVS
jgi:acyl transferase domain-containing protein/non-ribosomal peptide synthetase component F/glutamate-1-semialdehyde aminotransferase/thioesterase domain-containing protein/acyl carrier protein